MNLRDRLTIVFDRSFKYWALIPLLIFVVVLTVYPVGQVVRMAFSSLTLAEGRYIWEFSGLNNFYKMLSDEVFHKAVRNTIVFVIVVVAVEFFLGLFLALVTTKVSRYVGVYRTILMLPILMPPIAIGTMWRLMLNPQFGLFNQIAFSLGLKGQDWLSDPLYALLAIMVVDVWQWTPYVFIILLAGLQSIPKEPHEAAIVDGATGFQVFRYITWPLLFPTAVVALMFRTINSLKVFDKVIVLTGGGPGDATEVISTHIYKVFFEFQKMDLGSFLALITMLIAVGFVIGYRLLLRWGRS